MSSEEEIAKKLKQGVEEEKQILGRFGFALWIIAILVGAYFVTMILLLICGQIETAGQFGDSFGAVTSLLTGVSVFAIVYTLHLQRKDLNTQRESLMLQIKEMSDTRAELERQTKQLVRSANEAKRAADAEHERAKAQIKEANDNANNLYLSTEPNFSPTSIHRRVDNIDRIFRCTVNFENSGATVTEVSIVSFSPTDVSIDPRPQFASMPPEAKAGYEVNFVKKEKENEEVTEEPYTEIVFRICISYVASNERRCRLYDLTQTGGTWRFVAGGAAKDAAAMSKRHPLSGPQRQD